MVAPATGRSKVPMYLFFLILGGGAVAAIMSTQSSKPGSDDAAQILPATNPRPTPLNLGNPTVPPPADPRRGALTQPDPMTGLYPAPAGPVPEGKVWSPDHGHWHNAAQPAKNANASATVNPESGLYDPPAGPVPEGKVWSPEHGHWHNLPSATSTTGERVQRPPPASRMHPGIARELQETYRTYNIPLSPELAAVMNQKP